jgi:hypothetical protein
MQTSDLTNAGLCSGRFAAILLPKAANFTAIFVHFPASPCISVHLGKLLAEAEFMRFYGFYRECAIQGSNL